MTSGSDEPSPDDDALLEPSDTDDRDDIAAPPGTLWGALGQIAAAALVVLALIALFVGGAVAIRFIFH